MFLINPYRFGNLLPAGAIAFWKAENNLLDEGGTYNGTATTAPTYVTGKSGNAWSFERNANKRVTTPAIGPLTAWTLEGYLKHSEVDSVGRAIAENDASVANKFGWLGMNANADGFGSWHLRYNGSTATAGTQCIYNDKWHKFALVFNGSTLSVYRNDLFYFSHTANHTLNGTLKFGTPNGGLDEIALYDSAKTIAVPNNLVASYNGSDLLDLNGYSWDVRNGSSPLYGDGSDGTPNGAWRMNADANNARTIPPMRLGAAFTIEFDFYPEAGNPSRSGIFLDDSAQDGCYFWNDGRIAVRDGGSDRLTSSATFTAGSWHTVKITYDGSKYRIYKNGTLNATEGGTHSYTWDWNRNRQFGANYFARIMARMDNLKLYNAVV